MIFIRLRIGLLGLAAVLYIVAGQPALAQDQRPNIVLILADDVALMDFGVYGGEADTPNIDALAARGALFTNYRTSPMCAPSRAMLMTGVDSHRTGVANLPETTPQEHMGAPGYSGALEENVVTVATRLQDAGYRTYMTGKWHLGHTPENLPSARGFDRTFALDATGADNWEKRPYLPFVSEVHWFADGEPTDLPDGFYSSEHLVDKMIEFIDSEAQSDEPFFSYLAFQAIHIPVQAPREFTTKYNDRYKDGWAEMRTARHQKAIELGLIPASAPLGDMLPAMRAFESLSDEDRALRAKSMAVNAGMLEAMDFHLGRLIEHLKTTGAYDNTVFIVTSDNGPEAGDPGAQRIFNYWLSMVGYSQDLETLGEKGSFAFIGPEFASAAASPSAFFKFHTGDGGLRAPLIMAGPGVGAPRVEGAFSFVTDIAPTILDLAGAPKDAIPGKTTFTGRSLAPVISGVADQIYGPTDAIGVEAAGQAALFKGDLKLVRNIAPHGDGVWRLFDLSIDPGETNDLSQSRPEDFGAMTEAYKTYAQEMGVLETPPGYSPFDVLTERSRGPLVRKYWWVLAGLGFGALAILYGAFGLVRRAVR